MEVGWSWNSISLLWLEWSVDSHSSCLHIMSFHCRGSVKARKWLSTQDAQRIISLFDLDKHFKTPLKWSYNHCFAMRHVLMMTSALRLVITSKGGSSFKCILDWLDTGSERHELYGWEPCYIRWSIIFGIGCFYNIWFHNRNIRNIWNMTVEYFELLLSIRDHKRVSPVTHEGRRCSNWMNCIEPKK